MKKSILLIILAFLLFSCGEEDSEKSNQQGSLSITASGFKNLGTVSIGLSKLSGIKISNKTDSTQNITITGLGDPFFFHRIDGQCSLISISPGKTCTIIFKFTPSLVENIDRMIGVNGKEFLFTGKGLALGEFSLVDNLWNAGSFNAGALTEKTFTFTNTGDSDLTDIISNTSGFNVKNHTCGEIIQAGETCSFTLTAQKSLAQSYTEQIQIYSPENSDFTLIDFNGVVVPSDPFGDIGITCTKMSMIANNSDTSTCVTDPITDNFGNIVNDGHVVSLSVFNLYIDGATTQTTVAGQVTFTVRATDTITPSSVIMNSASASGFVGINLTTGPPSGSITFQTYSGSILADGNSYVTVKTTNLVNNLGVTVSDGEVIEAVITGPGTLAASNLLTYNGTAQIRVNSTTVSGTSTVTLRSDPIRDVSNNIIGWNASGSFDVNFIPVPDIGNFSITSLHPEIYYLKNGSGFTDETTITVGPILNIFDTPIGSGHNVDIVITNGLHGISNSQTFTLVTDGASTVSFPIKGDGIRGEINISAFVNGAYQSLELYASGDYVARFREEESKNELSLYYAFSDSRFSITDLSPVSSSWLPVKDNYLSLMTQDTDYYGLRRVSGKWEDIDVSARHYVWDCMIPVKNYVISTPCADKRISGGGFIYSYFFPYLMNFNNINTPITIGGNIGELPNHSSGFDGNVVNPSILYSELYNQAFLFGGAYAYTPDSTNYYLRNNDSTITYGQLSLFAYMPFSSSGFTDDLAFPLFSSHSTKGEKTFFFGGLTDGGVATISAGNLLQRFQSGDLETVVVVDGSNGRPEARYLNGVYFDEEENRVYIVGGLDISDTLIDDIWYTDLDSATPQWERVCVSCGLSDNYQKKIDLIKTYTTTGTVNEQDILDLDVVRPLQVTYTRSDKKILLYSHRSTVVEELDITTGTTLPLSLLELNDIASSDSILYHNQIDRFYKQKVLVDGQMSSRYYFYDTKLGYAPYYMASLDLGLDSKEHAFKVKPVISAWSQNKSGETTEYGVEAYCYNFISNEWELLGENINSSLSSLENTGFNITLDLANPRDFINISGKSFILIKAKQDIGYQNSSSPESGEAFIRINHIEVEGAF